MRFIIWILLLTILLTTSAYAPYHENELSASIGTEIDYNSPNDLSTEDLVNGLSTGQVDPAHVDDAKLSGALRNSPSLATNLNNDDLTRAISNDMGLMNNIQIANQIDTRAQQDPFILNDNPQIRGTWFSQRGITDNGQGITDYNGNSVTTLGSRGTTFNINNFAGASISPEGELITPDGTTIGSGMIYTNPDTDTIITIGSDVNIPEGASTHIEATGGNIQVGDITYTSPNNNLIQISTNDDGSIQVTSNNVAVVTNGEIDYTISGTATVQRPDHVTIHPQSTINLFNEGEESVSIDVQESTDVFLTDQDACNTISGNCIESHDGQMWVRADNPKDTRTQAQINLGVPIPTDRDMMNNMRITVLDNTMSQFEVDTINDNSRVTLFTDQGRLDFTSSPMTIRGTFNDLDIDIVTNYQGNRYTITTESLPYLTDSNTVNMPQISHEEAVNNIQYLISQGYTLEDIARAIRERDWGAISIDKIVLSDGHEGSRSSDPELVSQLYLLPPRIDVGGDSVSLNHAFAAIAVDANAPVTGQFRAWAYTTGGDSIQVFGEKMLSLNDLGNAVLGSGSFQQFITRWRNADGYHDPGQQRGNIIGRDLVSNLRGDEIENRMAEGMTYDQAVSSLFNQQFEDYIASQECNVETMIC